jgi:Ala-tRNA(Pro) deacylase
MTQVEKRILKILKNKKIDFKVIEHEPVYTCEKACEVADHSLNQGIKSLFLKSENKKIFLVLVPGNKRVNLKILAEKENTKKVKLARPEEVKKKAKVTIGSCAPFGYRRKFRTYIDTDLFNEEFLFFNPGVHTKTIKIKSNDLKKIVNGREFEN